MRPLLILALLLPMVGNASGLSAASAAEITHLLGYVSSSGCAFYRNGSWNSSLAAAEHMQNKYRYLLDRQQIADAEQFIARAATKSSITGKAYQVRCGTLAVLPSADFLAAELGRYRAKK